MEIHHNYLVQSPDKEAASHSVTLEFPKMLWNPNVHYCVHKSHQILSSKPNEWKFLRCFTILKGGRHTEEHEVISGSCRKEICRCHYVRPI
jgi:hypothetical protein